MTLRRAVDRMHTNIGWLDSHHTFSFGAHFDSEHMGFRALRVINDDRVAPGGGFGTHPHRDMEIISYVLDGALEHRDSMGNGSIIRPGDVQRMSAGTGVTHSEFNHSPTADVHFLQIWIEPSQRGLVPSYEQVAISNEARQGQLALIASPRGRSGSVTVHQDVDIYAGHFGAGESATWEPQRGGHVWLHVARGEMTINGQALVQGDGASFEGPSALRIEGSAGGEVLVFDLA